MTGEPAPVVAPGSTVCLVIYGGVDGAVLVESRTVSKVTPKQLHLEPRHVPGREAHYVATSRPGVWAAPSNLARVFVGATPTLAALAVIEWHNEQVNAAEGKADTARARRDTAAEALAEQIGRDALLPALRRLLVEAEAREDPAA